MSEFRAKVRIRCDTLKAFAEQDDNFIGFLTNMMSDPDLGVIVTNVTDVEVMVRREYRATVHVRVIKPAEFERVLPEDYCRIHMTDEDLGFDVMEVQLVAAPN